MRFEIVIILLMISSCSSEWYLTNTVTIDKNDLNKIHFRGSTQEEIIHNMQSDLAYQPDDAWKAATGYTVSGIGLGLYEAKHYYSPSAFPQYEGTWFYKWFNMNTSGEAFIKWGHPDKVARLMNSVGSKFGWNHAVKFFGGNWVYAYAASFIIENAFAGLIRNGAKYGTFWHLNFEINTDAITQFIR